VAVPVVVVSAFLLLRLTEHSLIRGDAAIGLISTSAMAIGVLIVSRGSVNVDLGSYLFGSILAMSAADVRLSVALSAMILAMYLLFYNRIFAVTFDEGFAKATGTNTAAYNTVIAVLTALVVVLGMRMMGTLLISSLIVFPALTAMRVCKRFRAVTICSGAVSVVCFVVGMAASYLLETPAGATVVAANLCMFLLFAGVRAVGLRL
jgi:zinc transport system permease protein